MSASVVVRPIEARDVETAARLIAADAFRPDDERPEDVAAYWRAVETTRERGGDVLVGERDGEIVGVVQVMVFPHFQHAGASCCELESFFVRADVRSRGVGAALLRAAEALARAAGCYRIQLTSREYRVDAHRFYRREGFEQTSLGFKKALGA